MTKPPDPRLFQKNFAMPMNPASVGETEIQPVRRKDGAPVTKVSPPGYGSEFGPRKTITRRRDKSEVPALHCTLYRKADGSRAVTVTEGFITHFVPQAPAGGDGVTNRTITGIWTGNLLTEHAITTGQAVGVLYPVDKNGNITADGAITVALTAGDEKSTHYIPPVGDDVTGSAGSVFVILARLEGAGDSERLRVYHEGNIPHYRELPSIVAIGGTHDIFKRVNPDTGVYETFGLTAGTGITITKSATAIEIKQSGSGYGMNIFVYGRTVSYADGYVNGLGRTTSYNFVICFRGGQIVGHWDNEAAALSALGEDSATFNAYGSRDMLDTTIS